MNLRFKESPRIPSERLRSADNLLFPAIRSLRISSQSSSTITESLCPAKSLTKEASVIKLKQLLSIKINSLSVE